MPIEQKDVDMVAEAIGAKFAEFKTVNDKRLEAVESEKSKLAGQVHEAFGQIKSLQETNAELEAQLKAFEEMQEKSARPGQPSKVSTEHRKEFLGFMRKGDESNLAELEKKALNLGSDADGGYAVPEEVDRGISQTLRGETPMRRVARVITVGTEDIKMLFSIGGAGYGWVGETDQRPETNTPQLGKPTPAFGEIYANPAVTQKTLDDVWFNPETWLQEELAMEFAEGENAAYTVGDANNKPVGFLNGNLGTAADETRPFGQYQVIASANSNGTLTPDEIKVFPLKMKAGYRRRATWMMQTATLESISVMKDTNEQYLWRAGLTESDPDRLVGRPIAENDDMPALAAGANAIAFGDFQRGFYIFDRIGTRVLRDPFTNKPYVHFYTTKRVGSMKADTKAIKVLQMAS